jgi:hypothetical protein
LPARYVLAATKVKQADEVLNQAQIKAMTFGEMASGLDVFYADTSNVQVPIVIAHGSEAAVNVRQGSESEVTGFYERRVF